MIYFSQSQLLLAKTNEDRTTSRKVLMCSLVWFTYNPTKFGLVPNETEYCQGNQITFNSSINREVFLCVCNFSSKNAANAPHREKKMNHL